MHGETISNKEYYLFFCLVESLEEMASVFILALWMASEVFSAICNLTSHKAEQQLCALNVNSSASPIV